MQLARHFTRTNVLTHLRENAGKRYTPTQIGHLFKRPTDQAREMLTELFEAGQVRRMVDGKTRMFFIPAPEELRERPTRIVGTGELCGWEAGLRRFSDLCMLARG